MEIKNIMFSIRDNKALGDDGYSTIFYQKKKKRIIIENNVCNLIKEVF